MALSVSGVPSRQAIVEALPQAGLGTTVGPGVSTEVTVTFARPFPTTPSVVATTLGTPGGGHVVSLQVLTVSTTQFSVRARWSDDLNHSGVNFMWIAAERTQ